MDEGCGQKLTSIAGDNQEGFICDTLDDMEVKVEDGSGSGVDGVEIEWGITELSVDTESATLFEQKTSTKSSGETDNKLTLGNKVGAYVVQADCEDCDEGTPVYFEANAICRDVSLLKQNDPAWDDEPYANICKDHDNLTASGKPKSKPCTGAEGEERWVIGRKGCAMTSIAMVLNYYYGGGYNPSTLNSLFNFLEEKNRIRGYDRNGNVDWYAVDRLTARQVKVEKKKNGLVVYDENWNINVSGSKPLANSMMDDYLKRCIPVIVKIITGKLSTHWVLVTGKVGNNYVIRDPGYRSKKLLSQYGGKIYSYRVYEDNYGGCK